MASCDSYLELINHTTVEIIPSMLCIKRRGRTKPNTQRRLKLENIIVKLTHSLCMYTPEQKYSHRESVRMHVSVSLCVWAGEGRAGREIWPWTLCLTGPFSKIKRSDILFHYALWFLSK